MQASDGIGWITALKSVSIRALIEQGQLQLGLFDERNLLELRSPEYPGERLVASRNPQLVKLRAHKREELLCATEENLEKIQLRVDAAKLTGQDAIGVRVGKVINQYKVAKHFELALVHVRVRNQPPNHQTRAMRSLPSPASRPRPCRALAGNCPSRASMARKWRRRSIIGRENAMHPAILAVEHPCCAHESPSRIRHRRSPDAAGGDIPPRKDHPLRVARVGDAGPGQRSRSAGHRAGVRPAATQARPGTLPFPDGPWRAM
jgi:hypothetical protein